MASIVNDQVLQMETTCGTLLCELQVIWDEVGESDQDRDRSLLELERECLEVYRKKVDQANRSRTQLRQAIADSEAELAAICSAMGDRPVHLRQNGRSLKEELQAIVPELEEMRKKKNERRGQFLEVIEHIQKISCEIGPTEYCSSKLAVDESDLSVRRLEELHEHLLMLQKEKADRLKQVLDHSNTLNDLCSVLGIDFRQTISEVHPSLDDSEGAKNINNATIQRLASAISKLRDLKIQRMQKLQDLATSMLELWNLMDTPIEEQQMFQNVTCNIAASEHEITEANLLSTDFINHVEAEVSRLEDLKVSKMKELVLKKKAELEELRRRTHMVAEADNELEFAVETLETGAVDPSLILEQIEFQIAIVKEEAFSRKDILEKVEKWRLACDEECWLEEYNRDENRYSAGRGAHLSLKRAEKARALVNKIPAIVESLSNKVTMWEKERGILFTYDGVRLLQMLEEYIILKHEKELERKRQRDQKKLQGQLIAEQEALYGSKPSPSKPQSAKKLPRNSTAGPNRRLSLGGAALQTPKHDLFHTTKPARSAKKMDEGTSTQSIGWGGQDFACMPTKNHFNASSARETETPRKPFTPLHAVSNVPSASPFPISLNNVPYSASKPTSNCGVISTPAKPTSAQNAMLTPTKLNVVENEEENRTPRAAQIPSPKTPMTVSVPMHVANTPAPLTLGYESVTADVKEDLEYSFEERRLAFLLSREQIVE